MTDEIVDDLIQRVLDGEGTPEETRRLEARLASDTVVRERHAELKALFDALAAVELEFAPGGIRDSIMSAVRANAPAVIAKARDSARPTRRPSDFLRLLLPVAAGFIAGALGWAALGGSLGPIAPPASLSGSMGDLAGPEQLLSLGPVSHGLTVSAARADKGATLLEIHSGASPLRVWIAADGSGTKLEAQHSAGAAAVEGAEGVLAFDLAPKTLLQIRCTPTKPSQAVRLTAKLADGTVSEGALRLDWLPWARRIKN